MRFSAMTMCRALATVCATAVSLGAFARNTEHVYPINEVLRKNSTRQAVGTDLFLHFGLPLPEKEWEVKGEVLAHSNVRPYKNFAGKTVSLSDEEACREAFQNALADLARQARGSATGLVGIVSNYNGNERSHPSGYECHAGYSRVEVHLKAHMAVRKTIGATAATAPAATAAPVAAAVPAATAAPAFARIDDVQAVPLIDDRGRDGYRDFLSRRNPRAFAIAPSGAFNITWSERPLEATLPTNPAQRALLLCNRRQQGECKLYAVDDAVVWKGDGSR
jgi:hypothetical protein